MLELPLVGGGRRVVDGVVGVRYDEAWIGVWEVFWGISWRLGRLDLLAASGLFIRGGGYEIAHV